MDEEDDETMESELPDGLEPEVSFFCGVPELPQPARRDINSSPDRHTAVVCPNRIIIESPFIDNSPVSISVAPKRFVFSL